jgi:hypothetical protein
MKRKAPSSIAAIFTAFKVKAKEMYVQVLPTRSKYLEVTTSLVAASIARRKDELVSSFNWGPN